MWRKNPYPYNPKSKFPYRLSRSKIELYLDCPRCFYLDRRLGIGYPSMPGFTLNAAVDILLKREFDLLRKEGKAHELMERYKIKAIPYSHPELDSWRENFKGIEFRHQPTNFVITGAVDDVWTTPEGKLLIVDYKSTSTEKVISLDDEYKQVYKRQLEIYQWIFRQRGYPVSSLGYFVFANAGKNRNSFDGKLEFELSILSYQGDSFWVEPKLFEIKKCLDSNIIPPASPKCEYCAYTKTIREVGLPPGAAPASGNPNLQNSRQKPPKPKKVYADKLPF